MTNSELKEVGARLSPPFGCVTLQAIACALAAVVHRVLLWLMPVDEE